MTLADRKCWYQTNTCFQSIMQLKWILANTRYIRDNGKELEKYGFMGGKRLVQVLTSIQSTVGSELSGEICCPSISSSDRTIDCSCLFPANIWCVRFFFSNFMKPLAWPQLGQGRFLSEGEVMQHEAPLHWSFPFQPLGCQPPAWLRSQPRLSSEPDTSDFSELYGCLLLFAALSFP